MKNYLIALPFVMLWSVSGQAIEFENRTDHEVVFLFGRDFSLGSGTPVPQMPSSLVPDKSMQTQKVVVPPHSKRKVSMKEMVQAMKEHANLYGCAFELSVKSNYTSGYIPPGWPTHKVRPGTIPEWGMQAMTVRWHSNLDELDDMRFVFDGAEIKTLNP